MAKFLLYILAAAIIGVSAAAVYEDCEVPPPVKFASIQIEDEETSIRAIYTCQTGYVLEGSAELECDLDTDEWNTQPPKCVKETTSNEVNEDSQPAKKKPQQQQNIPEDPMVSPAQASTYDMTCVQAKVKAPEIRHGFIQKYDRRRKGDKVFLVALYSCNDNFEFEDTEFSTLYCSERKWVGELPVCVALGEYAEEEEEYEEYEEGDDDDTGDGEYEEERRRPTTSVTTPPPPPPTQPQPVATAEEANEISNEISPVDAETPQEAVYSSEHTNKIEEEVTKTVTDTSDVEEATPDVYSPTVVDDNCGTDNGGCDQKCQRVLFPGENEPRIQCSCAEGFSLDPYDYSTCHDINECELPDIAQICPHGCENTPGAYRCITPLNNREETDDDDEEILSIEEVQPTIITPPETQQCSQGYRLQEAQCVDIDECAEGTSGCDVCVNTEGSYECTCRNGYDLAEDEKTCVDVDECTIVTEDEDYASAAYKVCSHECQNTVGSFVCTCPPHFHLTDDRRTCAVDTCADLENPTLNKSRCSFDCEDQPGGSYRCVCPQGYGLVDGFNCVEQQDACQRSNGAELCAPGSCRPDESEEGFSCICPVGFRLQNNRCVDVDECSEAAHQCSHKCINLEGGFRCECPEGFFLPESSPYQCEDVNECVVEPGICGNLKCVNFPGAFNCLCADDSEPNEEGICASMITDPCADNRCSHECVPHGDRYLCACPDSMSLDESLHQCVESDVCANNKNGCDHICNSGDNGSCSCHNGFTLDVNGKSCLDIDECQMNNGGCHQLCTNVAGAYACACEAGFELGGDLKTCLDIDECAEGKHDCSHGCVNLDGGFQCSCPQGYFLGETGSACVDEDECNGADHGCSHDCYNTVGSYLCACPEGLKLAEDEKTCMNAMCYDNNGGCSHTCDAQKGCMCPDGWILGSDGKTCEDFNECLANNGGCSFKCNNLLGSHECVCPDGSKPANPGDVCPITCPAGFTFGRSNPDECEDIDECSLPGVCQYECRNTNGSYECLCPKGYRLENGRDCVDIDECAENNGGCLGGECFNHNGGFECKCPLGQRLAFDRKTCEAIPEMRDQCLPLDAPANGAIQCTKYRHKTKRFYNTRCKVWCNQGFLLEGPSHRYCNASGQWDKHENLCLPTTCPRLSAPHNGVISPVSCIFGKINVGEQCRLKCHTGYVPAGKSVAVCTSQMLWSYNGTLDCVPMQTETRLGTSNEFTPLALPKLPSRAPSNIPPPTFQVRPFDFKPTQYGGGVHHQQRPYIKCPRNTTVFLTGGERTAHIILQKPITNMDYRYIESSPPWTRNLQAHLGAGTYVVVFRGHDPLSGKKARCKTVINVKHAEGPSIEYCTSPLEVTLGEHQAYRSVVWEEPRFDNKLGTIRKVYKSRLPGELFGVGVHTVYYEATNIDGITSKCEFTIHVKPFSSSPQPLAPLQSQSIAIENSVRPAPISGQQYHTNVRPSPVLQSPVTPTGMVSTPLLAGHESFIVCPGREPVKVVHSQSVELPPNCILKNVRINPYRHFTSQRILSRLWSSYRHF